MLIKGCVWITVFIIIFYGAYSQFEGVEGSPRRILLDTDVDTDDIFALLYLLKQNKSEFNLEAVTINANAWSNAGHAVNHIYDILFMMGRDDISVGVGGEGGMQTDGTIQQDVGGYLPIIDQGVSTAGGCRYRQAIPVGPSGRLEVDTNYGIRKAFLPQGARKYTPLRQATAQQVIFDKVSAGPITVFIIGAHTNIAIFLMKNPLLKKHIEHIYVMGGGHHGNLFTAYTSNPYAEFNIFGDPFAAYQVFHSGIPLTLVPLEATDTIPITREFFKEFESRLTTYEAQYCFESLKLARDTRSDEYFYTSYFMWDSFMSGVAVSIMRHSPKQGGENEFAEMKYMNMTVVTSNKPYGHGVFDGSNPFFNGLKIPKFGLGKDGVHSGHVQTGLRDPFCLSKHGKGRCKDGYTEEVTGSGSVRVLVATRAKPNRNLSSPLDREFFTSFLDVLTSPSQSGRFNFKKQFPYYKGVLYKPDFRTKKLGKTVVFDMDMSAGDFLALFYLLKVPVEVINLKAILVSPTGWANAATIDVIYDLLHMMRRDDIAVGLGDMFPMNQSDAITSDVGDCKYVKAIPHGAGGLVDSDTLYGFARSLPRSPRRYTSENSVRYGAPQNTSNPELRQPLVMDVWDHVVETLPSGSKITVLTNGPLTNLAKICLSGKNTSSVVEEVYVVGGQLNHDTKGKGNVFTIPSNEHAELNMFLDPLAARTVFESGLNVTLIPLGVQKTVSSFPLIIERLHRTYKTPEAVFARRLLSMLHHLQQKHHRYHHVGTFLGELLGAVILAGDHTHLDVAFQNKHLMVIATGVESVDGQICIDEKQGKLSKVLERVDPAAYYHQLANRLGDTEQSATLRSKEVLKIRKGYGSC